MDIATLPKVELHVHLDCSLSYRVVEQLRPGIREQEYRDLFIAPFPSQDLNEYIDTASHGIELMQDRTGLQAVTLDLFEQLARDQVIYAEIRFAPLEHLRQGMSPEAVVETVLEAMNAAQTQYGIRAGLILCTLRHYAAKQSMQTAQLVIKYHDQGVVAFDIASDEAHYPVDNHVQAFQIVHEAGIPCTAHAGEARGPESVWETLQDFQPQRLGHGVRSIEDPSLMRYLKEHRIFLEVCPTSNIQTQVFRTIADHPINALFRYGIPLCINTDGRTLSDTTLTKEYLLIRDAFDWTLEDFIQTNLDALDAAFLADHVREELKAQFIYLVSSL